MPNPEEDTETLFSPEMGRSVLHNEFQRDEGGKGAVVEASPTLCIQQLPAHGKDDKICLEDIMNKV